MKWINKRVWLYSISYTNISTTTFHAIYGTVLDISSLNEQYANVHLSGEHVKTETYQYMRCLARETC